MYKTIVKIDGMMCGNCEAHVNDALRAALPLDKVKSSHSAGETTIIADGAFDEDAIKAALKDTGYTVLGVESAPYEKTGLFGGGAR